ASTRTSMRRWTESLVAPSAATVPLPRTTSATSPEIFQPVSRARAATAAAAPIGITDPHPGLTPGVVGAALRFRQGGHDEDLQRRARTRARELRIGCRSDRGDRAQ